MNPPARNALWRFGFPNPVDYQDNELYCGGFAGNHIYLTNVYILTINYSLDWQFIGRRTVENVGFVAIHGTNHLHVFMKLGDFMIPAC